MKGQNVTYSAVPTWCLGEFTDIDIWEHDYVNATAYRYEDIVTYNAPLPLFSSEAVSTTTVMQPVNQTIVPVHNEWYRLSQVAWLLNNIPVNSTANGAGLGQYPPSQVCSVITANDYQAAIWTLSA